MNEDLSGFESAYNLIINQLNIFGSNAEVYFKFLVNKGSGFEVKFTGMLNLIGYQKFETHIECNVSQILERFKFNNRLKIPVDLEASEDLGGNVITPVDTHVVGLHSKVVHFITKRKKHYVDNVLLPNANIPTSYNPDVFISRTGGYNNVRYHHFFGELSLDEGGGSREYEAINYLDNSPTYNFNNVVEFEVPDASGGSYEISFKNFQLQVIYASTFNSGGSGSFTPPTPQDGAKLYLRHGESFGSATSILIQDFGYVDDEATYNIDLTGVNYKLSLSEGDKLWFHLEFPVGHDGPIFTYLPSDAEMVIDYKSTLERTETKAVFVHPALKQAVLSTSESDALVSDYLETGPGKDMVLARGLNIRNFDGNIYIKTGELLDTLLGRFNLGYNWEGTDFRVEEMEHFYRNTKIADLGIVSNFKETPATDYLFNQFRVAYQKFLDEELNTLDEFNTYHEYLIDNREDNALDIKIPYIASGYAIEFTRRKQFEEKSNNSWRYDDDIFLFEVGKSKYFRGVEFDAIQNRLIIGNDKEFAQTKDISFLNLSSGSIIQVFDGANAGLHSVIGVTEDFDQTFIQIDGSINTSETIDVYIGWGTDYYNARASEDFTRVDNLIDPYSSYNLKHTPKRILLRYAALLKSSVYYTLSNIPGPKIKNTFSKYNGDLVTQLANGNAHLSDPNALSWIEKNGEDYSDLSPDEVFRPLIYEFEVRMTWSLFETIEAACRGGSDYGFLSFITHEGLKFGYLLDLSFDAELEKAELKLIAKA